MIMSTSQQNKRRVVITGMGIVSPIGIGVDPFWESLAAGKSGIAKVDLLSSIAAPDSFAGEVKDFTDSTAKKIYLKQQRKSIKIMCREIQMGVASASLALENSVLNLDETNHDRLGVGFGANLMFSPPEVLRDGCWACVDEGDAERHFHAERWGSKGLPNMEPLWLLKYLPNMPACHIGIFADARGPNNSITQDEASGNLVLGEASRNIMRDRADVMIAGTTGTRVHPVKSVHAFMWDELATSPEEPERRCRPFDLNRGGQVVGEGACSFILEEESHAQRRGATILGAVLGTGSSCVLDRQGRPSVRQALVNAIRAALHDAGLQPQDIGHINANGLGSKLGDVEEARAIQEIFGEDARKLPVTALKSYFGNAGSGCGTLELAGSLVGLLHGVVPATLNFETPDPECPLNVVHGEPLEVSNHVVLKLNVTRMGQASALVATVA